MIVPPGAASVSLIVQVLDDSGLPVTGLVAATFPTLYYARSGEALPAAITLSDLAAQNSAFSAGGIKELAGGYYRADLPDAAWATASKVRIIGEATNKRLIYPPILVAYVQADVEQWKGAAAPAMTGDAYARLGAPTGASVSADLVTIAGYVDTEVAAIKAKTDLLTFTVSGYLDCNIRYVNSVSVDGSGTASDPWGPV